MKMCEMSSSHLAHAINYFKPFKSGYKERWSLLMTESERRSTKKVQSDIFETQIFNIFCAQLPIAITPPPQMGGKGILDRHKRF